MSERIQSWHSFKNGNLILQCHIQPGSSVNQIVGLYADRLKIKVAAAPTDGKANKALVKFLSKEFGVAQSSIAITKGELDHKKTVQVTGLATLPRVCTEIGKAL